MAAPSTRDLGSDLAEVGDSQLSEAVGAVSLPCCASNEVAEVLVMLSDAAPSSDKTISVSNQHTAEKCLRNGG